MDPINTIQLNEDHRIVVEYDLDRGFEPPTEWAPGIGWHAVVVGSGYLDLSANDVDAEAIETICDWATGNDDRLHAALERHFQRKGYVFELIELTAYRDYLGDYLVYAAQDYLPESGLTGFIEAMRQYVNGQVYTVSVQSRVRWRRDDDPDVASFTWETDDSICGVYIDPFDDDEVKSFAGQSLEVRL